MDYKALVEKIIKHGGGLTLPHKDYVDDWYSHNNHEVFFSRQENKYGVHRPGADVPYGQEYRYFDTLDEAMEIFIQNCNDIGAIQQFVCIENEISDSEGDLQWERIQELVEEERDKRNL